MVCDINHPMGQWARQWHSPCLFSVTNEQLIWYSNPCYPIWIVLQSMNWPYQEALAQQTVQGRVVEQKYVKSTAESVGVPNTSERIHENQGLIAYCGNTRRTLWPDYWILCNDCVNRVSGKGRNVFYWPQGQLWAILFLSHGYICSLDSIYLLSHWVFSANEDLTQLWVTLVIDGSDYNDVDWTDQDMAIFQK